MKIPNPILTLFFLLNPPLAIAASMETCLDSVCGTKEPVIRFPFHTEENQAANTCGYPGFRVSCNDKGQTLLNLPNWGELKIRRINYAAQQVWVNDPNNCLPKLLLSLNLSGFPFNAVYYQEFSFFNCSVNVDYLARRYKRIACLSDSSNYAVFATPSRTVVVQLSSVCVLIGRVKVPVQSPFFDQVRSSDLGDDLRLSWDSPACGRCESHGGRCCGFTANSTCQLDCHAVPSKGISQGARYAIAILIVVPAMLCFIGILNCACSRFGFGTHGWAWAPQTVADFEPLLVGSRRPTSGLDGPTIESYPKIVIGESPKAGDQTCSICLSEYMAKETVKRIPECGHCFHAQCIDEWLQLHASCPICRTSPQKIPPLLA